MEPSILGSAFTEGGPYRKIKLDCNPGIDEVPDLFNYLNLFFI